MTPRQLLQQMDHIVIQDVWTERQEDNKSLNILELLTILELTLRSKYRSSGMDWRSLLHERTYLAPI